MHFKARASCLPAALDLVLAVDVGAEHQVVLQEGRDRLPIAVEDL